MEHPKDFDNILAEELNEVRAVRARKNETVYKGDQFQLPSVAGAETVRGVRQGAGKSQLIGLAFSGGGIRSATFNLGILQGLAKYKLLPRIDYLSTVSGGGYIGGWFTTWIKRRGLQNVMDDLTAASPQTGSPEPEPVSYLRKFSNYLTPKVGLLNADALTAAAIYLRNLALNLAIMATFFGAVILVPRLVFFSIGKIEYLGKQSADLNNTGIIFGVIAVIMAYVAVIFIFKNLASLTDTADRHRKFYTHPNFIKLFVVSMLFMACLVAAISMRAMPVFWKSAWSIPVMTAAALVFNPFLWKMKKGAPYAQIFLLIPTGMGAFFIWGLSWIVSRYSTDFRIWTVFAPPALVLIFSACGSLYIGLMGKLFDSGTREWLSRLGAWILIAGLSHIVLCGLAVFGPFLAEKAYLGLKMKVGLLSGWLVTTVGGVLAGKSRSSGKKTSPLISKILIETAPYIFILGLLLLLSWACGGLYDFFINAEISLPTGLGYIILGILLFSATALGLSMRIDVNAFSMHNFYRNRLIRCYIGASDDDRNEHPWTGFDMREHCVRLCEIAKTSPRPAGRPECPPEKEPAYEGPYQILSATLNLVGGQNLAWQKRKAQSFIMSPLYCGYDFRPDENEDIANTVNTTIGDEKKSGSGKLEACGYRPTHEFADGISVGTAMAISGAAVSPSMGHYSSPAVAFLMTIFNVRLGQWLGNPRHMKTWKKLGPPIGLLYLFSELFSLTSDRRGYVYLSDGGHFENLGLYELVRRRCRYIIVCDAGQDKEMSFSELGTAIEKCRSDFGIDIDIDVDPIRAAGNRNHSNAHCVVGKIKYDKFGPEESHGFLVYIKASLTGDEPTDVVGYAAQNEEFPHQSTSDQWFDESQFESYRALGAHIAESVLEPLEDSEIVSQWSNERIFVELSKHWHSPGKAGAGAFTKHSAALSGLYSRIRSQDDLKFLDAQLVPEWDQMANAANVQFKQNYWLPSTEKELRAGFYMTYRMIKLMESVYIDLNLEEEHDHPDNRGWMNLFRNWSWSGMFRVSWTVNAGTLGAGFQSFCNRHLNLDCGEIVAGEPPELFELRNEERQKLFSYLRQKKELNYVEETFLRKFITILAVSGMQDGILLNKSYFPLEYHPLKIRVSGPSQENQIFFHFGFALMTGRFKSDPDIAARYAFSKYLVYFRVQDHVRKMGFGRTLLENLLRRHKNRGTFIRTYPLKQFEKRRHVKDDIGEKVTGIIGNPLFPAEDERKKFDILFDSVQKGIGLV
jgi:hypothetical protein